MLKTKIPFQQIGSIPPLIKDFLNEEIPAFSAYTFSLEKALAKAEKKSEHFSSPQRTLLVEVLERQHQHLTLTEKQKEHLRLLLQENTFTVCTGHQLNLFSGPVFFVYKILQTIKTAAFLSQHLEKKFVPIFWMATEDHDFEEVNHFQSRQQLFKIPGKSGGAVGRMKVEEASFIEDFEKAFKDDVFGTQLILLLKKAYAKGNTFTEATQILVQELFSEFGLLMIDGDDALLKNQMADLFSKELNEEITHRFSKDNIRFIEEKYGKVQVNPREINLFYLSDTRNRIVKTEKGFEVLEKKKTFSFQELTADWTKISPNALLRPVFQEKVLPNVAYIGGNAEIMYWLELPQVFEAFNVDFPLLIPRNAMVCLPSKTYGKIEKSGFAPEDFFDDFHAKVNSKLLEESSLLSLLNQQKSLIEGGFTVLKEKSASLEKTFTNLVEAEETRQLKSYERMKKRLLRAEKIKQADRVDFLQRLYLEIHPSGSWQERSFNFSAFFAEKGMEWLEMCYREMDVDKSMLILMEY